MATFVTKTLIFRSYDLGADATLIFTFDDKDIPGIYKTVFPMAFKLTEFGQRGGYSFRLEYTEQFGFKKNQVSDLPEPASTFSDPMKPGQETSLTQDGGLYLFSVPKDIQPPNQQIVAHNNTPEKQNIEFGFFLDPKKAPTAVLFFEGVGSKYNAQIQFTPLLRAYVTTDYDEGSVIRTPVNSPVVFSQDLTQLKTTTEWKITYNSSSGDFTITQE